MDKAYTVLVVDDSEDIRETLRDALNMLDYQVLEARNGREAFDVLKREGEKIDLVLLDLMMPVLDGWQFLDLRRADPAMSKIPVVVVTASHQPKLKDPGVTLLKKPVQFDDLRKAVDAHCRAA